MIEPSLVDMHSTGSNRSEHLRRKSFSSVIIEKGESNTSNSVTMGSSMVGLRVGVDVGFIVGLRVGWSVGEAVSASSVGSKVGTDDGLVVG